MNARIAYRRLIPAVLIALTGVAASLGSGRDGVPNAAVPELNVTSAGRLSMTQAIHAAQDAVFIVGALDDQGGFQLIGTGFAVADGQGGGIVATNAHVAAAVNGMFAKGMTPVVRRPGPNGPTDFVIKKNPTIHPGYTLWNTLKDQGPVRRVLGGYQGLDYVAPADVALLRTAPGLGAVLPLAEPEQLVQLQSGTDIIYLGFPAENITGQQDNIPQTVDFGHIQSMSGIMLQPANPDDALIVHHDMQLTGGSSGGPIMVQDPATGRLVVVAIHNAGSFVFLPDARIPVAKSYAQRADFLRELLEGQADVHQAARNDSWARALRSASVSTQVRLAEIQNDLAKEHDIITLPSDCIPLTVASVEPIFIQQVRVEAGKHYLFVAAGMNWDKLRLTLENAGKALAVSTSQATPSIEWTAQADGTIDITLTADITYGSSFADVRAYQVN